MVKLTLGREMDAQVARLVMGMKVTRVRGDYFINYPVGERVPEYSTRAEDAADVIEALLPMVGTATIGTTPQGLYLAVSSNHAHDKVKATDVVYGATIGEALCRLALNIAKRNST